MYTLKMNLTKPTVLVVEDEIPLQKVVGFKLELAGFNTISGRTTKQALEYLDEIENIDLIWLDHYLLGKETGMDLVVEIKKNDKYKHLPIFLISNSSDDEKKHIYIGLGIDKYFIKAEMRLDAIIQDIKENLQNK